MTTRSSHNTLGVGGRSTEPSRKLTIVGLPDLVVVKIESCNVLEMDITLGCKFTEHGGQNESHIGASEGVFWNAVIWSCRTT